MKIILFILSFFHYQLFFCQSLSSGDIAFIGWNTDAQDAFAFIALTDIPGSCKIYFTDRGTAGTAWGPAVEDMALFTAPTDGIPCGTIVTITDTDEVGSGVSIVGVAGASWAWFTQPSQTSPPNSFNLSAGDQILAFQKAVAYDPLSDTPNDVTFIAALHGDDGNGAPTCFDPTTGWNDISCISGTSRSTVPPGLINGVNCVALFPALGTEIDNAKYNGTLIGTSSTLRAQINDHNNWISDDTSPYDISPTAFSPSVSCLTPLSIELSSFTGNINENYIQLNWSTNSEYNSETFLLEKLNNVLKWSEIGKIKGSGYSNDIIEYSCIDFQPFFGLNYYRIKQGDFNGDYSYSNIIAVDYKNEEDSNDLLIFPNPASNEITLKNLKNDQIKIINVFGVEITSKVSIYRDLNQLDISNLESGAYILISGNQIRKFYKL